MLERDPPPPPTTQKVPFRHLHRLRLACVCMLFGCRCLHCCCRDPKVAATKTKTKTKTKARCFSPVFSCFFYLTPLCFYFNPFARGLSLSSFDARFCTLKICSLACCCSPMLAAALLFRLRGGLFFGGAFFLSNSSVFHPIFIDVLIAPNLLICLSTSISIHPTKRGPRNIREGG